MALFPAYSPGDLENNVEREQVCISEKFSQQITENELLASDSEESQDEPAAKVPHVSVSAPSAQSTDDFFIDCKLDRGNLRVSTLYYPGRPQYECRVRREAAGGGGGRRWRRYFARRLPDPGDPGDLDARDAAFRRLLAERPADDRLWESYVLFQERCTGSDAALRAAEEAASRRPDSEPLRARLLACLRAALPAHERLERLRDMLTPDAGVAARAALWEELLTALGAERGSDPAQLTAAAAAALAREPRAVAPRVLHALGSYLRAAGLWERLVLLLELLVAMNYAPAALPAPDRALVERAERRATELEERATSSGLPMSAVWVRAERARAAAHWRAVGVASARGDPQRAPTPADVADLLLPLPAPGELLQLSVRLLQLAKVPMLPAAEWSARALGCGAASAGGGGESILPLLWAARALPAAHPARPSPEPARRLLALLVDPPHYFSDDTGYLSWVRSLWEAAWSQSTGAARVGLACWRLRWLQALALVAAGDETETRRLRGEGRSVLRRLGSDSPLPFAEWARLELCAGEAAGRAASSAQRALRAALQDASCPPHHTLYVARVVCEVSGSEEERRAALVRAVRGGGDGVGDGELRAAREECERRCEDIERELEAEGEGEGETEWEELLLPGREEWARTRAALATGERRRRLLERACGGSGGRYWEEAAEELGSSARDAARLAPLFPHNAALAMRAAGAPLWARGGHAARPGAGLFASTLPAWFAALRTDFAPPEAEALVRACRRSVRAAEGGGAAPDDAALAAAALLEAEARAPRPRLAPALYGALERAPQYKWLYVRGAAWCGSEAEVLADALLERSLRLHALPAELRPPGDFGDQRRDVQ